MSRTEVTGFLPPIGTQNAICNMAKMKSGLSSWKTFQLGILAGAQIAYGGTLAISLGGQMAGTKAEDPGLQKLVFGAFGLPFGLTMVIICGAELATGNFAVMSAGYMEGVITLFDVGRNWLLSFLGNFAGSLLIVWLNQMCETFHAPTSQSHATALAISIGKSKSEFFVRTLFRGIMCNWLVCIAVWQATAAQDVAGKILGIFWPICAFVAIGYEHVVANMFLIPMGMAEGSGVSIIDMLVYNILPVTIGNMLAGIFMVGGSYSMMFGVPGKVLDEMMKGEQPVKADIKIQETKYDQNVLKNTTNV